MIIQKRLIHKNTKLLSLAALLIFTANVASAGSPAPVPLGSYYSESSMLAPLLVAQRPTTDGRIYMANLDAKTDSLQQNCRRLSTSSESLKEVWIWLRRRCLNRESKCCQL